MSFDPDAAAGHDGIYGLPFTVEQARFVVVPVPFDATTSFRDGARNGPAVILAASRQVDLLDVDFGRPWESGIAMLPLRRGVAREIARWNAQARRLAGPIIDAGGAIDGRPRLARAIERVNDAGSRMNEAVYGLTRGLLAKGKVPIVLGGDHSTPFGAIKAYAERYPGLGILHVDAHADLREAYEGFTWSHASIMWNVTRRIAAKGGVAMIAQVGIRDLGEREQAEIGRRKHRGETRILTHFDSDLRAALFRDTCWADFCDAIVRGLPKNVYVSIDIDGLDPVLCPDTGTPVPGGLTFSELVELLKAVVRSGRKVVGADLSEVAPSPRSNTADYGRDWNGNVGARVLYKLIGAMAAVQAARRSRPPRASLIRSPHVGVQ